MILQELSLQNFRNFKKKSLAFSSDLTVIVGPNTIGKTNILEAIHLLASGRSFRAEVEKEMIGYGEEMSNVKCQMSNRETLEILLTTGQVANQPAPHKKFLLNGVSKHMIDFVGNLRTVLFWPEDLELATGSPSVRRKYLDLALCQVDREYARPLLAYEKGVRQRNKLLERIRDEGAFRSQLAFWNQLLIKNGGILTDKRKEYIDFINGINSPQPSPEGRGEGEVIGNYQIVYDKSIISESRLEQYGQNEIGAAMTLVGPHRDDFRFMIRHGFWTSSSTALSSLPKGQNDAKDYDLSLFGSRGEQRMAILWLKLGELEFMSSKTGERPILLLDDIFSELDHEHRRYVLKIIPQQQTILTTTDLHLVDQEFLKSAKIIEL